MAYYQRRLTIGEAVAYVSPYSIVQYRPIDDATSRSQTSAIITFHTAFDSYPVAMRRLPTGGFAIPTF